VLIARHSAVSFAQRAANTMRSCRPFSVSFETMATDLVSCCETVGLMHGDYERTARLAQMIKTTFSEGRNWPSLSADPKKASSSKGQTRADPRG
jgi:hypothetical protein